MDLGRHWLVPKLPAFLSAYPRIQCALGLTDRFIDLVEERVDVGLRMGESSDARLVRRRLGESRALRGPTCSSSTRSAGTCRPASACSWTSWRRRSLARRRGRARSPGPVADAGQ
ncbi:hypothetical protein D7Y23_06005 [Corallococcus sp. AB050B]|nr:hypothetical protein D7Y23_06005 [Corallococcus sp. AB050B]